MIEYKDLEPQIHICPDCGRVADVYSVADINDSAPCINCQLKRLGKENEKEE